MKVALIGNICGNLPALEAVLTDLKRKDADLIINAGGSAINGPFPNETLNLLRKNNIVGIAGKTDRQIARFSQKLSKLNTTVNPDKWLAIKTVYETLNAENRNYLASLNRSLRLELDLKKILITSEMLFPGVGTQDNAPDGQNLASYLRKSKSDIIVWADGERPSGVKMNGVWIINAGSVGGPAADPNEGPRAHYTIIQFKPGFFQFRHYSVPYDILKLPQTAKESSFQSGNHDICGLTKNEPAILKEQSAAVLESVNRLLRSCITSDDILAHSRHVARLAVKLFDALEPLHGLTDTERFLLECAALLHDIGWFAGEKGHHKVALDIIIHTDTLLFSERERFIIGSIARYHRKGHPDARHLHFATLEPADRRTVTILAGIIRIADGLDRSHQSLIESLHCAVSPEEIRLVYRSRSHEQGEIGAALTKGTLLEQTFGRKLVVEWNLL